VKYGAGGLRPAWEATPATQSSPLWHYPLAQVRDTLERLVAEGHGSPCDGAILEYTHPLTGGPVMPTIACYMQMLRPGEHTQPHRHVCCTNYHVVEGSGYSLVGGQQLDWEDKDVFTVPTWTFHEHVNTGSRPAFLFSFSDAPVMKALDLYREEAQRDA
jgi:gentisate 1,2-dioxygenase